MTDAVRLKDPVSAVLRLPRGSGVIVRHTDTRKRRILAETLAPICRHRGLICLIADDWRLAAHVRADGLHLPERKARLGVNGPAFLWRRQSKRLLTTAAHSLTAMMRGARTKADAIVLAPVFTTASHPNASTLGAMRFAALVRQVSRPVIALGGITARTARRLTHSGARGLAGIGWSVN